MTAFAINVVLLCDPLWLRANSRNIADQLSRAATSTASNYRVASRARSRREFISKIGIQNDGNQSGARREPSDQAEDCSNRFRKSL